MTLVDFFDWQAQEEAAIAAHMQRFRDEVTALFTQAFTEAQLAALETGHSGDCSCDGCSESQYDDEPAHQDSARPMSGESPT